MADILALLIVFGLLAALVGTLATGLVRLVGFGVLVALALIIGTPIIRGEFQGQSETQANQEAQQVPAAPQSTQSRPTTLPANGTNGTNGAAVGGPSDATYSTTGGNTQTGGTTNSTNRGVRAMW
ncbi:MULTISPECIES: hypothetical protein [unclassified Leptolyngbya]|uniref:hypothetical protein n=1 Tax=unclassified Leptolyngbya TaxID=2650499 RepID=UPI0016889FC0|nr:MULTISPECIES: hypothetical protein [unclassified Leptolyngbya]MBD1911523.1 hypothetical protein [Leptolyngbya sp. FACHB-8]MBD2155236.1 hypothetical protein [Leptolyngbya sp. FACHB-16]